jgi:two-component system chemotaxis response regulator CheB
MVAAPPPASTARRDIVVIGASAGGVHALRFLIARLPPAFVGSILMVLHRSSSFVGDCPSVLSGDSRQVVREPIDGEPVRGGSIYLAPRDVHMIVEHQHIRLVREGKEHFTRPAADPLFRSAAETYGPRVVGIVLTGGGHDGLDGLLAIKAAGGISLVQDPSEARVDSMPRHAIAKDHVDAVLSLEDMASTLAALMSGDAIHAS